METELKTFLIVCPLVFLAGFVDSIAGGGGLISLPAYLLAGLPVHNATATNKISSVMGTFVSTIRITKKTKINWKRILPAIVLALIGSSIGSKLNLVTDDEILKKVLLVVLPVAAILTFLPKKKSEEKKISEKAEYAIVWCSAFVLGVYDGFYGPGTGTFLMLVFIGLAKMDVLEAASTTKFLNLSSNIAAVTTYLLNGKCLILLGVVAGACNMLGAYLGSGLVIKDGNKIVRPIIVIMLILLFSKILIGW